MIFYLKASIAPSFSKDVVSPNFHLLCYCGSKMIYRVFSDACKGADAKFFHGMLTFSNPSLLYFTRKGIPNFSKASGFSLRFST